MLRLAVLLLILANGVYYAWSQGLLLQWGYGPVQQAEPQRVAQQIRPEALRIARGDEARRIDNGLGNGRAPECLQTGPLDDAVVAQLRPVLEAWPAGSWSLEPVLEPARWIIYMGKYPSADAVARKRAELRQIGVSFEPLSNPELEPGLSLGGFSSQAEANQQLDALAQRGVRTARVVQERAEQSGQSLKLPLLDDSLRARLEELRSPLGPRNLRACR